MERTGEPFLQVHDLDRWLRSAGYRREPAVYLRGLRSSNQWLALIEPTYARVVDVGEPNGKERARALRVLDGCLQRAAAVGAISLDEMSVRRNMARCWLLLNDSDAAAIIRASPQALIRATRDSVGIPLREVEALATLDERETEVARTLRRIKNQIRPLVDLRDGLDNRELGRRSMHEELDRWAAAWRLLP